MAGCGKTLSVSKWAVLGTPFDLVATRNAQYKSRSIGLANY
jgi:hypothetical protein